MKIFDFFLSVMGLTDCYKIRHRWWEKIPKASDGKKFHARPLLAWTKKNTRMDTVKILCHAMYKIYMGKIFQHILYWENIFRETL